MYTVIWISAWKYTVYHVAQVKVILWYLSKATQISYNLNNFCRPEATGRTDVKLYIEPWEDKGTYIYQNIRDHMSTVAVMPIFGKNL